MTIVQAAAFLTAGTTLLGGAWVAGDYTGMRPVIKKEYVEAQSSQNDVLKGIVENQQQLTNSIIELQFQSLNSKQEKGVLDFHERQRYCGLAKKLDYVNIQGCQ